MPDRILLRGLVVDTRIGVHERERLAPQPVEIDVDLGVCLAAAGRSDRLGDTVDYEAVEQLIRREASGSAFYLLEALGESLADRLLAMEAVRTVRLRLWKRRAGNDADLGVELERHEADVAH